MGILSDEELLQHQAYLGSGFASLRTVQSVTGNSVRTAWPVLPAR